MQCINWSKYQGELCFISYLSTPIKSTLKQFQNDEILPHSLKEHLHHVILGLQQCQHSHSDKPNVRVSVYTAGGKSQYINAF